jgi:hypothetical protein
MRSRDLYSIIVGLAVVAALDVTKNCQAKEKRDRTPDRLLSFTYAFNRQVRPIIEAKLLQTPASHGRMIRLQGHPESAVSVNCSDRDESNAMCRVTLIRAQSNMENTLMENWGQTDAIRKVEEIAVVRTDAGIPKTTATAFRDCLRIMIPEPGDPLELHSLTITDNDRIEFWLEEPNTPVRKGERAEKPGKRSEALIRIGDLLARYCEVSLAKRPGITKAIEMEAAHILSR